MVCGGGPFPRANQTYATDKASVVDLGLVPPPIPNFHHARGRYRAERLEVLLAESLTAAQRGGAVEERHLRRVTIDTTVQPKAVTHPTDSKLLHRGIEILARLARRHGIRLRQSYLLYKLYKYGLDLTDGGRVAVGVRRAERVRCHAADNIFA
jgi:hypothetical protein